MQRKLLAILGATVLAFDVGSASAQQASPTPDRAAIKKLLAVVEDPANASGEALCTKQLPALEELARLLPNVTPVVDGATWAAINCASRAKDYDRAYALFQGLEAGKPGYKDSGYGIYLAAMSGRIDDAYARLSAIAVRDDSEQFSELNSEAVNFALRKARERDGDEKIESIAMQFAEATSFFALDPDFKAAFAREALIPAIARKDDALITRLIGEIRSPTSYVQLLADRDYASIWPLLEERVGPHFEKITRQYADRSMERYATLREDRDRISDAAHALYFDGRWAEGLALTKTIGRDAKAKENYDEGDGWALNIEAYTLDALGRFAESDAVFDLLATLPPDDKPWVVNYVINRASRLVGQGRWLEGLAAADLAAGVAEEHGSDYAKMLIASDHICALVHLDRTAETAPHLAFIEAHQDDAPGTAVQALQCLGRDAEAGNLVVAMLADEKTRSQLLTQLQAEEFDLFYTRSLLPQPRDLVATDAKVREALLRHARIMPEALYPTASIKRAKVKTE